MEIKNFKLSEIRPYENNPRKNLNAIEKVANSIEQFGFRNPILVDKKMVIVAGHTRYEAAKLLGLDVVPCIVLDNLTEDKIKAYRIADNKVSEFSEWDFSKLSDELDDIEMDMMLFGFRDLEMEFIHDDIDELIDTYEEPVKPIAMLKCPHCEHVDLKEAFKSV